MRIIISTMVSGLLGIGKLSAAYRFFNSSKVVKIIL